jgi:hypothetical protein
MGLLGPDQLPTWRTAFVLALVAWLPPAILAVAQSLIHQGYDGWAFFQDGTVYTRYLVAVIAMVVTERFADDRISMLVNQFLQARLLESGVREEYRAIVARADQRASSSRAEGLIVLLALSWSWLSFYFVSAISVSGWEEWSGGGESQLSWAGTVAELVANPIFLFLVMRWFWRFTVWTLLLSQVSKLRLTLTAMHPDRAGGLIFLGLFPGIFSGFVFALSCVVCSSLVKSMALLAPSQAFTWMVIGGWVIFMALVFLAPLLFFSAPLYRAREKVLITYSRLAQAHHQAFERTWVDGENAPENLLGSPDPSSATDLNSCVQAALDMRIVPLDWAAVLQILIAAGAPFLVILASLVPLGQIVKWLLGALL